MKNLSTKRVLFLDDDLDLQETMIDYFTPRGFEFICLPTAELGATEMIRRNSEENPIDLILTDFRLPNMNGIEFIEQTHRLYPKIPIILITGHVSLDLAIEAIEKGADDFVVKPIQFQQLAISMERAVYFSRLQLENQNIIEEQGTTLKPDLQITAKSKVMKSVIKLAKRVAKSDATVFITGESGTGKELLANLIHSSSHRSENPFIAINCSAIPENLLESELFGHAKGSFTGADEKKIGLFEEANEGTLFLDEIGDLSLPLQAKLLRVIQERKIKRVGENKYRDINVRLIAATHKTMNDEVSENRFREDLFYRLNVIPMNIPPLRERHEDILPLAIYFFEKFRRKNFLKLKGFSKDSLQFILRNKWKGNVRELENAIERAVIICNTDWIEPKDIQLDVTPVTFHFLSPILSEMEIEHLLEGYQKINDKIPDQKFGEEMVDCSVAGYSAYPKTEPSLPLTSSLFAEGEFASLETIELRYIKYVLECTNGVKDRAAKILRVDRKTLYRKIEILDLANAN